MDVIKAQQISARPIEKVIVHPLVLLSIVDNYNRGVLLGSSFKGTVDISNSYAGYVPNPVLVIIDVQPKELGIPTKAYYAVEEVKENATLKSQKVFVHVPSEIAAHEVEEIGVEHLLRDVKDTTISTLATEVTGKFAALKGLDARLRELCGYLDLDVFNLLPNLNVAELIEAFAVKTNDMMLVIYLSSLIRSVVALHDLINSKMLNKEHEKAEDLKPAPPETIGLHRSPFLRFIAAVDSLSE
ncbi:unnamed protein product [Camellia sinensis]